MTTRPLRRRPAIGLAIAVALVLLSTGCDWTQFGGNAALNGTTSETQINSTNVASLHEVFTAPIGSAYYVTGVSTSNNTVYATTADTLEAFDLLGSTGCSGSPKVCQPLWTAPLVPGANGGQTSQPLISNGVVYVTTFGQGSTGQLAAFDAAGSANCAGSPKVCQPLWTAAAPAVSGPGVDAGTLFVANAATNRLEAYDATGSTNCAGSPKVCQPLWTSGVQDASGAVPSIAGGKVYLGGTSLQVFDEAGSTGCSGAPKVCQPLWTAAVNSGLTSVDVSGGVAYTSAGGSGYPGVGVVAYDAGGAHACSGTPTICQPLWDGHPTTYSSGSAFEAPAVSNGWVYDATHGNGSAALEAFPLGGGSSCDAGVPPLCWPTFIGVGRNNATTAPVVAGGLVFLGGDAFDAAGQTNCTVVTGPPAISVCQPVWSSSFLTAGPATISNGNLILRDQTGTIHVFKAS